MTRNPDHNVGEGEVGFLEGKVDSFFAAFDSNHRALRAGLRIPGVKRMVKGAIARMKGMNDEEVASVVRGIIARLEEYLR